MFEHDFERNIPAKKIMAVVAIAVIFIAAAPLLIEYGNLVWTQYIAIGWGHLSSPQQIAIFFLVLSPLVGYAVTEGYSGLKTALFEMNIRKFSGRPVIFSALGSVCDIFSRKSIVPEYIQKNIDAGEIRLSLAPQSSTGFTKTRIIRASPKTIIRPIRDAILSFKDALEHRNVEYELVSDGASKINDAISKYPQKKTCGICRNAWHR